MLKGQTSMATSMSLSTNVLSLNWGPEKLVMARAMRWVSGWKIPVEGADVGKAVWAKGRSNKGRTAMAGKTLEQIK